MTEDKEAQKAQEQKLKAAMRMALDNEAYERLMNVLMGRVSLGSLPSRGRDNHMALVQDRNANGAFAPEYFQGSHTP